MVALKSFFVTHRSALILSALFFVGLWLARPHVCDLLERVSLRIAPSAERALAVGEKRFNSRDRDQYDFDRADAFFQMAYLLDPKTPRLNYERARIAFLRSDFAGAMRYINTEIAITGDDLPQSYYMRGLIEGYVGQYDDAVRDYEHYLTFNPTSWAGHNDYVWVLLKAGEFEDARRVAADGLRYHPENLWLLNNYATALFETGDLRGALSVAKRAAAAAAALSDQEWLHAYPGNDPRIAGQGALALKSAAIDNMHTIEAALASSTVQLPQ